MKKFQKSRSNVKGLVIGSGLAAAAGFMVGILTAPKSGKQTRGDIKNAAEKGRRDSEKELKKLNAELTTTLKQAKDKSSKAGRKTTAEIKDLLEKAGDTKEKLREILSAVHEGDAEDADLRRAVKNAKNAIEHLKDYLKK